MRKIIKIISAIIVLCIVLSGCSTRQSLSDLTIVEALGIDYKNGQSIVTMQYLNFAKSGGTTDGINSNITSVAGGTASSISGAVAKASAALAQDIFFGQNKVIVFGKEYVEYGIDKGLDYLLRSVDSRPDVLVAMSDNEAENVIKSTERDARIPAESLYNLLETGEQNGFGAVVAVDDLLNMYSDKTSDIYLPVISIENKTSAIKGIAIFTKDKYQATLNKRQSLGFLILKNKIDKGYITVKDEKLGEIGIEIIKSKACLNVEKTKNGYTLIADIKTKLTLDEIENGITVSVDEKKIKEIEALVNKSISSMCEDAFNTCISNESDALMLGRYLSKHDYSEYESVKDDWLKTLSKFDIKANVTSKLEKVNDTAVRG